MSANYLEEFKNPSSMFRGAPFWSWNCKLEKEVLLKQIDYFHEMGMGGFTMHCRTGLDTEYMGEEFMDIVKACVQKAKQLNMKAYLYDEDRWPSGFGGGEVTKDTAYRSRYMVFSPFSREELKSSASDFVDSSARGQATGNGTFLAKYEVTLENGYLKEYRRLDEGETGSNIWYAYMEISGPSTWYNNQAYVNSLDKKAIERFIETTYEKYYKALGEEFGGTVPSIFTDEPQFVHKTALSRAEEKRAIVIPYTDGFEERYRKDYGQSFLDYLPEVFWELPENKVSVTRYRYHDLIAEIFAEAFSDTLGEWCDEHHIYLTGHMMEEPSLRSQTAALGEAMRHYRGFRIPGIDMLCDGREYTTAKQAQSAAHQMGGNQITSELYGVTNWDFDFRGHKLQGDWQAALGITHRVHHLSWVSMAGEAKRDYPASIFYQSPWYRKYNQIETYFGRVNTALRSGKPQVRIGVIHPVESYWLYYGPGDQTSSIREKLQRQFDQVTEWLLFGLLDFDYISEALMNTLKKETENGFGVGEMSYDTVIIPGCVTLRSSTLDRLREFIKSGGKVIVMGDLPKYADGEESGQLRFLEEDAVRICFDNAELMNALKELREFDLYDEHGMRSNHLLYQIREDGENKILFIANGRGVHNHDIPGAHNYTVSVRGTYQVTVMDAMTGESRPCAASYRNGKTEFGYRFYPEDSLLVHLVPGKREAAAPENKGKRELRDAGTLTGKHGYHAEEPNVLMLDQCRYSLDGEAFRPAEEILRIDNILRRELGYPLKNSAVAQPWTDTSPEENSHRLKLSYTFESEIEGVQVTLAAETVKGMEISFNGTPIPAEINGYYVDNSIKRIELSEVKAGMNELILTMPYNRKTNLEWCYILGEFGVAAAGNTAKLVWKPEQIGFSDLTSQYFPFYGGNMVYHCEVEAEDGEYELEITKFRAPLISVKVDGKEAGDIMFAPYRINLGHLSGRHELQITSYGNRINTFGPVHCCDEGLRWMGPDAWRTEGVRYSYEYQLKRTGILAAPKLYKRI
ncbi:hypothetical protein HNQ56_003276 [Anaerotaenia torta]|uniref:glycosyl hydrolase n=1 Tax=Anaerotaenia torta TaxID=433293 RepID=UPI003D1FA987